MNYTHYSVKKILNKSFKNESEQHYNTTLKTFKKGMALLIPGGMFKHNYFVISNIIQSDFVSHFSREKIMHFVFLVEFIGKFLFMFPIVLTRYNVVSLTDCELKLIEIKNINVLSKRISELTDGYIVGAL
jgi:hypothetical protein